MLKLFEAAPDANLFLSLGQCAVSGPPTARGDISCRVESEAEFASSKVARLLPHQMLHPPIRSWRALMRGTEIHELLPP